MKINDNIDIFRDESIDNEVKMKTSLKYYKYVKPD